MKPRWPRLIVILHWLSALTIVGMFASGLWMVDLTYYSDWYKTAPHWHKSAGLLLLAIVICRLVVRTFTSRPPSYGTPVEKNLSRIGHGLLYALMIALFTSGYLISTADGRAIDVFNWFSVPAMGELFENQEDIAGDAHFYIAWSVIVLAVIHTLAALKHHFLSNDDTLKQMLRLR
ncbi:cytochrome b [Alteromonas sp. KUL156]|uniref:cytochrome b n=1 Tax=Alteromonas sp. KUL106 TaxID=2480799 RepID=UPI0012E55A5E|nr:cytochrome b [Alteromonas sp. KUL106]GFD69330.1 cytochrome b [Alteromonas sp. KUL106]GFD83369.1 cytochrome b [Tenacibaculum sp. KUL118]GFD95606.1 cytochrome b [Alteromonas sp. KUL154]GFD98530.1 cytochrome b [Alteromonas sp. KUL156]